MKKLILFLLIAVIVIFFGSCAENTEKEPEHSETNNAVTGNTETVLGDKSAVMSGDVSGDDTPEGANVLDDTTEDYSDQINAEGDGYELDGRVSDYPIVIGEHEHNECDDTDAELMALGQEKFDDAVKLYKTMMCLAPEDVSKFIYDEYDNEIYAIDEAFGTYESIMELCRNTFAPDAGEWRGYVSVERPEELLDSGLTGLVVDGEYMAPTPIAEVLDRAMSVEDGITYKLQNGGYDSHRLATKIIGVMSHTDTCIEYRLCTMVLDESAEALAVSEEIPQVFYEHSVMKLELIDIEWLVTQLRDDLGNEVGYNEVFIANYGLAF